MNMKVDYEISIRMSVFASVLGLTAMIGLAILARYLDNRDQKIF